MCKGVSELLEMDIIRLLEDYLWNFEAIVLGELADVKGMEIVVQVSLRSDFDIVSVLVEIEIFYTWSIIDINKFYGE